MKVAVLLGGISREREVSFSSGFAVARALRSCGHEVILVDPTSGAVEYSGVDAPAISRTPPELGTLQFDLPLLAAPETFRGCDCLFLVLHGTGGEDGTIQAILGCLGLRYTGSGVAGSAAAMDKVLAKRIASSAGVPSAPWLTGFPAEETVAEAIGFPCVVKPSCEGSSVGLSLVADASGLAEALARAAMPGSVPLLEGFLPGREVSVGILDGEPLEPGEILPANGSLFDYEAKYQAGGAREIFPASISSVTRDAIRSAALTVHNALGLRDYSRIDFRLDANGVPCFLEANTLPGMTPLSLLPRSAEAAGISFEDLCERICQLALRPRRD